ncbi:hypothetical protein BMS3Abin01_00035 [bacterium BMS3Abin01]|nr:hypothetical protein BMS3Abin01_00035 [bacterium BMS3Abin01]HDZ59627.1 DNA-protecting protein DprA [Actinomycetota bacterium]
MDYRRQAALSLAWFLDSLGRPVRLPPPGLGPSEMWRLSNRALSELLKLRPGERERLTSFRRGFSAAAAGAELRRHRVIFIARGEELYPLRLACTPDPPVGIFAHCLPLRRDRLAVWLQKPRVAIVGARAASQYGTDAATMIAAGLGESGVCVVSGMAMGIDAAAHRGALETAGGSMAVLGGGVDVVYPAVNRPLYRLLAENGAVLSEYPPASRPRPWRFPARNRIIAGISRAVVVVEARERSGSLITADFCLEQGGEVCAVPGSIFSELSAGPNRLIQEGAMAVTTAVDLLQALGLEAWGNSVAAERTESSPATGLPREEEKVYMVLGGSPRQPDTLAARTGLSSRQVAASLIALEIKGLARHEPGRGFSRLK